MRKTLKMFLADEEAPTTVEYAILVAGLAVIIIAAVFLLGTRVNETFRRASGR